MKNNQMQFTNKEFGEIKVILIDGEPYFPATECAKMLGYSKPNNAISRHCPHSLKRGVGVKTGVKSDGSPAYQTIQILYIPESDLYRLITHSKLPSAQKFEKWVYETVLPSIRKHGAYIEPDVLDTIIDNPQEAENLLKKLKAEQTTNARLREHVKYMAPRARFCDEILDCENLIPISVIAKDYGFSAVSFNRLLHSLGIQHKIGDVWLLYKEYADCGYTKTRTYPVSEDKVSIHTYWTFKGWKFLYEFLKFYGILPTVPKNYSENLPL